MVINWTDMATWIHKLIAFAGPAKNNSLFKNTSIRNKDYDILLIFILF